MREQFERLPEIAAHLKHGNVYFSNDLNKYVSDFPMLHVAACYVNGAWYAFQEQQKKIDAVLHAIAQSELHGDRAIWGLQDEIKGLLK